MTFTKKSFAVLLSKLRVFENPDANLEQYPTDSEIAAEILWHAALINDIQGKNIIDVGCGTGILGIGCLLLGAKKVVFADIDKNAIKIAKHNLEKIKNEYEIGGFEFITNDINKIKGKYDVVVQNPPFGVKDIHADKKFLETAFNLAPVIYTLHKIESKEFISKISDDNCFKITNHFEFMFPLKQTMEYHKKRIHRIKAGAWRLKKE